jgi:predicted Rossmann fold nucleotide-binding protein DprA/Smf involved in DNA uptake
MSAPVATSREGEMKHVAIVGSRRRSDRETVDRLVAQLPEGSVIVSGGAPGPDNWAEEAARKYGREVRVMRPHLEAARTQGQRTRRYHARNQRIADLAHEMFALVAPDRKGGTEDAIRRAQRKGIPITIL